MEDSSQQEHIFGDVIEYVPATTGQRFLNWLIDNLLMQYGLAYLTGIIVGYGIAWLFPDYAMHLTLEESTADLFIIGYAIAIFNYLIYYTICEKAFRGYTLGKLISGTRAIRNDGAELTIKDALLRSLSRLVPFEVFSGFSYKPWHDLWTKTQVIKAR